MDNVSGAFSQRMQLFERKADKYLEDHSAKGEDKVENLINTFLNEVQEKSNLCTLKNSDFTSAFIHVRHLAEKSGSQDVQFKIEKVFSKVFDTEMAHFNEEMTGFLDVLKEEGEADGFEAFASIKTSNPKSMQEVLKNPENLVLLVEYGSEEFVKKLLFFSGLDAKSEICKEALAHAIDSNNKQAVSALTGMGTPVNLERDFSNVDDSMVKFIVQEQLIKSAKITLAKTNPSILNPPDKPGGPNALMGQLPTIMQNAERATPLLATLKIALPLIKYENLKKEGNKAFDKHGPFDEKKNELKEEIAKLDARILEEKEQVKGGLIKERNRLEHDLKEFTEVVSLQEKGSKADVMMKAVDMVPSSVTAAKTLDFETVGRNATLFKGLNFGSGALTSALNIYKQTNEIASIDVKIQHLTRVSQALDSTKNELKQLSKKIEPTSIEGRLIALKMKDIDAKIAYIEKEKEGLRTKSHFNQGARALSLLSASLMTYGTIKYFTGYFDTKPQNLTVNPLVDQASNLGLVSSFLPMVGPPLVTGSSYLYEKASNFINPPITEERLVRQENEQEVKDLKESMALSKSELSKIEAELSEFQLRDGVYFRDDVFGFTEIEEGTLEHTELIEHRKKLSEDAGIFKEEIRFYSSQIAIYESAQHLGITGFELRQNLNAIHEAIRDDEAAHAQLKSIIQAAGVDVENFDADPDPSIIAYLTK